MFVTLRIRHVPIPLVAKFFSNRYRPSWATSNTTIRFDYDVEHNEMGAIYPEREGLRDYWHVFWNVSDRNVIEVPIEFFKEKVDEQSNEGFAAHFKLSEWQCQAGVSSMRRGLETREESSSGQGGQTNQVDMPQSELSGERQRFDFEQRRLVFDEITRSYRGAWGNFPHEAPPEPASPTEAARLVRTSLSEAQRIRSEWERTRGRLEEANVMPRWEAS